MLILSILYMHRLGIIGCWQSDNFSLSGRSQLISLSNPLYFFGCLLRRFLNVWFEHILLLAVFFVLFLRRFLLHLMVVMPKQLFLSLIAPFLLSNLFIDLVDLLDQPKHLFILPLFLLWYPIVLLGFERGESDDLISDILAAVSQKIQR